MAIKYLSATGSSGNGSQANPWGPADSWEAGVSAGDTVYVSGSWTTQLTIDTNSLNGTANARIIIDGNGPLGAAAFNIDTDANGIISNNNDYLTIQNFAQMDGTTDAGIEIVLSDNVIIDNCHCDTNAWDGILVNSCTNTTVRNCSAAGNLRRGIGVAANNGVSSNVWVINCHATGNGRRGFTYSGADLTQDAQNGGFIGCHSSGNGEGFQLDHGDGLWMIDCSSTTETLTGLDPEASELLRCVTIEDAKNVHILDCKLRGNSSGGCIRIVGDATYTSSNIEIRRNILYDRTTANEYAIHYIDANAATQNITGNVLYNNDRAIVYQNNTSQTTANNTVIPVTAETRHYNMVQITGGNLAIRNNAFFDGTIYIQTPDSPASTLTIDNNHYSAASGTLARINGVDKTSADITDVDANAKTSTSNPGFHSHTNRDYRLDASSSLIAQGNRWWSGEPPHGQDGMRYMNTPAIGAYEVRRHQGYARKAGAVPANTLPAGVDIAKAKAA